MAPRAVNVSDINDEIIRDGKGFIDRCEKKYSDSILKVAEGIRDSGRPIVLLSGPSGSGKTTSALRLEKLLDGWGNETHTISMDEYFIHSDENQITDENGNVDYESPYRVDIPLLEKHLEMIANCEPVELPHFDFSQQKRVPSGRTLCRKKGELVILEGIHALNPLVTGKSQQFANGVYISIRTRIRTNGGELIHPSRIRLMRRLIRDKLYRGRELSSSFDMYDSVERGENLYIMPFKGNASFSIDSFIGYEVCVYKNRLLDDYRAMVQRFPEYGRFSDIERLLSEIVPADEALIPDCSLLREFVGGSSLDY